MFVGNVNRANVASASSHFSIQTLVAALGVADHSYSGPFVIPVLESWTS